jgi:hypothetical protein
VNKRRVAQIALVVVVASLLCLVYRPGIFDGIARAFRNPAPAPDRSSPRSEIQPPPIAADRSPLADALNSPATDIQADLRLVAEIVDTFRSNFLHDGNPVGNNAEITAALVGKNKLRLSLIPPDHPAIDRATGELRDRWGTPFIFHAQSGTQMEVRSAGPDKKPYTADDAVFGH